MPQAHKPISSLPGGRSDSFIEATTKTRKSMMAKRSESLVMPKLRALNSNDTSPSLGMKDLTPDKSMGSEEKKLSLEVLEELPE